MKVFKVYVETENGIEVFNVLANSRRGLKLPEDVNGELIKVNEITKDFKNEIETSINNIETLITDNESDIDVTNIKTVLATINLL